MVFQFPLTAGFDGGCKGFEPSPAATLSASDSDLDVKQSGRMVEVNSSAFTLWRDLVSAVLGGRSGAKIRESIVKAVPVFVVDFVRWPFPSHIEPSEPVSEVDLSFDADLKVSVSFDGTSNGSFRGSSVMGKPFENAGSRVVFDMRSEGLCVNHGGMLTTKCTNAQMEM